jgi:hypothetical protein
VLSPGSAAGLSQSTSSQVAGVTSYLWLYFNYQLCSGNDFYQVYRGEYRFHRNDTARTVKYSYHLNTWGRNCSNGQQGFNISPVPTYPCWGPCGNSSSPLWSRTQINSVSWPYLRASTAPDYYWIGQLNEVKVLDNTGYLLGTRCHNNLIDGNTLACPFNF